MGSHTWTVIGLGLTTSPWFWFSVTLVYALLGVFTFYVASRLRPVVIPALPHPTEEELQEEWDQPENGSYTYADVMRAFRGIERVAREFNTSSEVNRRVLYAAAVSLFISAVISFIQGYAVYAG